MQGELPPTGNTEQTQPENKAFYPALDGLRAIAFLMVFAHHYIGFPWGWSGVNVFFVLSGFLITGILFDTRNDRNRAWNFYVRRTLRIFPLYYGVFLLLLVTTPFFKWSWSGAWAAWPLYAGNFLRFLGASSTITGSTLQLAADAQLKSSHFPNLLYLGHFWSLCVEEQFYLFWPWLIFFAGSRKTLLWTCGLVVVFTPLARVVVQHQAPKWMLDSELLYRFTPFQLDSLLLGALLALLLRGSQRGRLMESARYLFAVSSVLLVAYAVFLAFTCFPDFKHRFRYPEWRLTWGLSLINLYSAALLLCALQPASIVFRVLGFQPLRWVGRISYGAYVLHDVLHAAYYQLVSGAFHWLHFENLDSRVLNLFTTLLALPGTLILASLSFRFLETPFLNLKERLTVRSGRDGGGTGTRASFQRGVNERYGVTGPAYRQE